MNEQGDNGDYGIEAVVREGMPPEKKPKQSSVQCTLLRHSAQGCLEFKCNRKAAPEFNRPRSVNSVSSIIHVICFDCKHGNCFSGAKS